jgi:hypothetical protein
MVILLASGGGGEGGLGQGIVLERMAAVWSGLVVTRLGRISGDLPSAEAVGE